MFSKLRLNPKRLKPKRMDGNMKRWYSRIASAGPSTELTILGDAMEWFEKEYGELETFLRPKGRIIVAAQRIGGQMAYTWSLLQELEAILKWAEIRLTRVQTEARKHYLDNYPKQLTDTQAKAFAEADPGVEQWRELINMIALQRNRYISLTKGLEMMHFQISNITKLKAATLDDADFIIIDGDRD